MTTPERLKRRQHQLGYVLVVMGLAMIGQGVYFNEKDSEQRECLVQSFAALSENLDLRSGFTDRDTLLKRRTLAAAGYESAAADRIWQTYGEAAGFLRKDPTAAIPPSEALRLQKQLIKDLLHYKAVAARVAERRERLAIKTADLGEQRADNPVPKFPDGTCED